MLSRTAAAVIAACCVLLPTLTNASDLQMSGDVGVGVSDNIARTATNERSETLTRVGLQFAYLEQSSRLASDVRGDLAFFNYAKNTYSSDLTGNAGAAFRLGLLDDRITWALDDNFGQTRRDLFTVVTPQNKEYVNYFDTGPNLALHLSSADRLLAQARYVRVDYQSSPLDTQRYNGQVGVEHEIAAGSRISIDASQERVEPLGTSAFVAYDRQEMFARYLLDSSRTKISLDAGGSRISRSSYNLTGALFRLDISRKLGDISTLDLRVGREFTDPGASVAWTGGTALPVANTGTQSLALTNDPYVSKYAQATLSAFGHRTNLSLTLGWRGETYDSAPLSNRRAYMGTLHADRVMGEHLRVHADFAVARYDYLNAAGDNTEKNYNIGAAWRLTKNLSLDVTAEQYHYATQVSLQDVSETRYWIRARYGTYRAP